MREPLALPEVPCDLPDPLAAAIQALDLEAIWRAISSLPRRQRRALVLRELGGLSYRELGVALGVSHSSVESLLWRARRQVRGLVAAASPLALRDELARLIPGFDPGSAGLAARVVSLPVAVKLAAAAVSVGVVTTGSAQLGERGARPQVRPAGRALVTPGPVRSAPVRSALVRAVSGGERDRPEGHGERAGDHRRSAARQGHESTREAERTRHATDDPAVVEAAGGRSGSGGEGSGDASGGFGSDNSGSSPAPPEAHAQPDGVDD